MTRVYSDAVELVPSQGRNDKVIWQDLVNAHGFQGSHEAVKRFVRRAAIEQPSVASRLEQLNRVAVGIFNLNLFAAGAYLHLISKTQTRLFQVRNECRQILHLKEHTVPSAGLLMTAILDWSGPRCPGTAQD